MPIDTLVVYAGVYADVDAALLDYAAIKDLHSEADLIDAFDAAVIERKDDGKVKIVKKHETPTRALGVLGGGVGLAATAGGAALGALAGHAAGGMSRKDLKELGETLDDGQAALVMVGVSDMQAKIERAMTHAEKTEKKELKADRAQAKKDAESAQD